MPSGGRERRDVVVSYRLTTTESARVDAAAAAMTPPRSRPDWCRAAALHLAKLKVPAPPPPRRNPARRLPKADIRALAAVLGQLGKIGSNLNQLARRANVAGNLPPDARLQTALQEVTAVAGQIRAALEGQGAEDGDQG